MNENAEFCFWGKVKFQNQLKMFNSTFSSLKFQKPTALIIRVLFTHTNEVNQVDKTAKKNRWTETIRYV